MIAEALVSNTLARYLTQRVHIIGDKFALGF